MRAAYGARADEYTELLGRVDQMNPLDRDRITAWAAALRGPVLDLGCGPGHWTAHLADAGAEIRGVDPVPEFVDISSRRFPHCDFALGDASAIDADDESLGGVLAWYSLIHTSPADLPAQLREIARVLRPGGQLLLGFFDGESGQAFDHAVTTAYFHAPERLTAWLSEAGMTVQDLERRTDPGARPHGSLVVTKG